VNLSSFFVQVVNVIFPRQTQETPDFISPAPWPPNSPNLNQVVEYRIWGLIQRVYKTPFPSATHQLEAESHWHSGQVGQAYHKTPSTKLMPVEKAVMCMHEGERTSL